MRGGLRSGETLSPATSKVGNLPQDRDSSRSLGRDEREGRREGGREGGREEGGRREGGREESSHRSVGVVQRGNGARYI